MLMYKPFVPYFTYKTLESPLVKKSPNSSKSVKLYEEESGKFPEQIPLL